MSPSLPARATLALVATLVTLPFTLGACDAEIRQDAEQADPEPAEVGQPASVVRAIDGDTIDVTLGGTRRRVRLLGIDAPESTTLRTGHAECGGQEASAAMRALVHAAPQVVLTADATQDAEDRYGRLLAYVAPARGGPTLQERMLSAGWAKVYEQSGEPIERDDAFRAAADQARRAQAGVWARCGGDFRRPR